MLNYFIPYKKVLFTLLLLLLVTVPVYWYMSKTKTIKKQEVKIESLEKNITFTQHDHVVEVENALTQNNAKNREKELEEIKKEIKHEEKNSIDHNVTYDSSIFDRMYLYPARD